MNQLKIIFLAYDLLNTTSRSWIHVLQSLGFQVTVLTTNQFSPNSQAIERWGKNLNVPVFELQEIDSSSRYQDVLNSLGGIPDFLFCWQGSGILKYIPKAHQYFPQAKVVFCVNTYPDRATLLSEFRENLLYRQVDSITDSYLFYSQIQRDLFQKNIPNSRNKPNLIIIEPFLEQAFSSFGRVDPDVPKLERYDDNPHIIFIGNASYLWSKTLRDPRKDALGQFFKKLSEHGIHIFVEERADTKGLSNLHLFYNSHSEIDNKFAQYISQFDAHLVMYNEFNCTSRRRVSTGLSTRFASAITSTCPIAVTSTSKFIHECDRDNPFWFTFDGVKDLVASLHNQQLLNSLRQNMEKVHRSYSFESRREQIMAFFEQVLDPSQYPQLKYEVYFHDSSNSQQKEIPGIEQEQL